MAILTVRKIDSTKPTAKDQFVEDGGGLFLKVAISGVKSFVYRYVYGSKRRLMTLGKYPETGLAQARQLHLEARKTLESGTDPLQVSQTSKQALRVALTVEQLGEEWLTRVIEKQFKRPEDVRRLLTVNVYPRIGKFLAKDITGREAALVINKIVDRGFKVQANRVLRILKNLFVYAVEQSHIAVSPVTMTVAGAGGKEESRERNLSFEETKAVLKEFETTAARISWQVRSAVKLLILTAQRPGEICGMEWRHINLDAGIWTLPKEITKSERAHVVHLSKQVTAILREIQPVTGAGRYVLTSKKGHIETRTFSQAVRKRIAASIKVGTLMDMEPFTPHDLRRTAVTRMGDIGVMPFVTEKILNHIMEGAMGIYNKAEYLPERKEALELWGEKVEQLQRGDTSNVYFLDERAA